MTDITSTSEPPREPEAPSLRLTEPEDLLSAIPYLLKFHPDESLVVLLLSGRRLVLTARLDLRLADYPDPHALAVYLHQLSANHSADGMLLVGYHPDLEWASGLVCDLVAWIEPLVHSAFVANGTEWWSCLCPHEWDDECDCDDHGTPYDLTTTAVSAHAVLAGLPVLPSRDELVKSVAGPADAQARRAATTAIESVLGEIGDLGVGERRDRMALLVEEWCLRRQPLTAGQCAELAVLAYDVAVRDVAAERMRCADAIAHVELWHQVVAHTVAPFESAPLCLLGLAAWIAGNGALQVVCMERAEQVNPDYSLLRILDEINARSLPPSFWQKMRAA